MPNKDYSRTQRVGDLLQHELAQLIQKELQDPRLQLITITAVNVSADLSHARILFTQYPEDEAKLSETAKLLNRAAGHLRRCIAQDLNLRIVPQLKFFHDTLLTQGNNLSSLIDAAIAKDQNNRKE